MPCRPPCERRLRSQLHDSCALYLCFSRLFNSGMFRGAAHRILPSGSNQISMLWSPPLTSLRDVVFCNSQTQTHPNMSGGLPIPECTSSLNVGSPNDEATCSCL